MITVDWTGPISNDGPLWDEDFCLYMYLFEREILYIGMAGKQDVGQRFTGHYADNVHPWISDNRCSPEILGIHTGAIIDGVHTVTLELLHDIETLLIIIEKPAANVANKETRSFSRRGMQVLNTGDYQPLRPSYTDRG